MRNIDTKLLNKSSEYIKKEEFINLMCISFTELSDRLKDITQKCDVFSLQFINNRLPSWLKVGEYFLGIYKIEKVITLTDIDINKLYVHKSVFENFDNLENR